MDSLQQLEELFSKLPGIGPRQAKRMVYYILKRDRSFAEKIADKLKTIHKDTHLCQESFCFFVSNDPTQNLSPIARDQNRDRSRIMVISSDADMQQIERSGMYTGTYFCLGGILPILEKDPEKKIRIKELLEIVDKRTKEGLVEIILALSATPEGEHTTSFIQKNLKDLAQEYSFTLTTLGRGLSTGTELEYSDNETIKNALTSRI